MPVLTLYYAAYKGVDAQGVFLTESAFAIGVVLMAVPAGLLGDKWQRKYVLALGGFIVAMGFLWEIFAYGWIQMAIGELFVGFGMAFIGTATSAFTYDVFHSLGREDEHLKFQSELGIWSTAAATVGALLGSFFYQTYHDLPMIAMVVVLLLFTVTALILTEPDRHKVIGEKHPLRDMADTVKYALHGHKEVACIIFFYVVLMCGLKLGLWLHQYFYKGVGVPESYFGIIYAAGVLASCFGSWLAKHEETMKPKYMVLAVMFIPVFAYSFAGYTQHMGALVLITMVGGIYGFSAPVLAHALNKRVSSERRGSVIGAQTMFYQFAFVSTAWLMGKHTKEDGVFDAMLTLGLVMGVVLTLCFMCMKKHNLVK